MLGLVYMTIAGAPIRYLAINFGALAVGLGMLALLGPVAAGRQWTGAAIVTMATGLLTTALLGAEVDGASRWVAFGGLIIQPSLILLPAMLVAFSRARSAPATAGIIVGIAAMALQPDRAMAAMLVLGLSTIALTSRDRRSLAALAASVIGFTATLLRPDTLPAVPYVDRILYTAFDVHAGAGLAVLGGSALLLVPAIFGWMRDDDNGATYATFGAVWFAAIVAAALGNYPTPIVGYGGSAIIGYALSLLVMPTPGAVLPRAASRTRSGADEAVSDRHFVVALG